MGLMKKLTSAIVASSLVFGMVGSAMAAYTPAAGETAGTRMMGLQILKGKSVEDPLALKDEITRAELVTIIVRAFGKEADAALLNGAAAFPDTASHWASGNIAMAKALVEKAGGDAIGMPDGSFSPDAKLTPAQAVAFLMKFIGVKADATKAWPANYLDVAVEKGLITAEDSALISPMLNDNATRGLVFYMFDRAFYNYDLGAGKTFYTKYVDPTKPVVTLNKVEPTTLDSKVTITGKVEGATELYVGTKAITADANGNFSFDYDLPEVKEYNIAVTARDLAGNVDEESVTVARATGTAATIEASAITVAAGATADVTATVKDAKGNALTGVTVTGESAIGTYADGKFTAGTTAGTGKLTLKAGDLTTTVDVTVTAGALAKVEAAAASVAPGAWTTVVAKDAYGNTVTGATFSESYDKATVDATSGAFIASEAGTYTVKATKDGVTAEGNIGVYGDVEKLVISAPATMVGNGATEYEVTVTAVDEKGNVVLGYEGPIELTGLTTDDDTVNAVKGVATFTVIAEDTQANGDVELLAAYDTDDNDVVDSDTFSAFVGVEAQVATSIEVKADGDYLPTNVRDNGVEVTVNVLDQKGEKMTEGAWEVSVALTGPATLDTADDVKSDDISITTAAPTFMVYPNEAGESGDVTVAVSFTGLASGKDTLKARFAQDPKAIVFSTSDNEKVVDEFTTTAADDTISAVKYDVQVVDKNGVPVTNYTGDLTLSFSDVADSDFVYVSETGASGSFTQLGSNDLTIAVTDGKGAFYVNSQVADTFTVKLVDNDSTDDYTLTTTAENSMTFTPASAAVVGLSKDALSYLRKDTAEANLSAQLYDRFGNKVAKSGVEITFGSDSYDGIKLNGSGKAVKVATDANGVASVTATAVNYVDGFTVSLSNADLTEGEDFSADVLGAEVYGDVTLTAKNTVPASVSLELVKADTTTADRLSSIAAGDSFYMKATVKDNYGRTMTGADLGDFDLSISDNSSKSSWSAGTDFVINAADEDGIYFSGAITPEKAEGLTMTVKVTGLAESLSASKTISVRPTDVEAAKIVEADSNKDIDITANKTAEFTVQLTDKFGNAVTSSQVTQKYYVTIDPSDDGEVRNADGKVIEFVTVLSGRTTAKFSLIKSAASGTVDLTVNNWTDTNADGVVDTAELTPVSADSDTSFGIK